MFVVLLLQETVEGVLIADVLVALNKLRLLCGTQQQLGRREL